MATYILFWNPAISSYTMERFLDDFNYEDQVENWSFHEHEKVKQGDSFYMVRCGEGNTGIVMQGVIESSCYESEDWSPKKRKPIYYANIWSHLTINPETAPVMLTPEKLTEAIPDFNWYGGHSGRLLNQKDANTLNKLWINYLNDYPILFPEHAVTYGRYEDHLLDNGIIDTMLTKKYGNKCEICGYDYADHFSNELIKSEKLKVDFLMMGGCNLPRLFYRICRNCQKISIDKLTERLQNKSDN